MIRVGIGYDSHRFTDARPLILAGVRIPGERGLAGHSDADAVAHATGPPFGADVAPRAAQVDDRPPPTQGALSAVAARERSRPCGRLLSRGRSVCGSAEREALVEADDLGRDVVDEGNPVDLLLVHEAEELTQDVFLTAWRKAARFDASRGRLSTWLMTIAHNLAVDRLRRETGVTRPTLVLVDEVPEVPAAGDEDPFLERDAAIRALQTLSDGERALLVRTYFGGLTAREIAQADGIPLGTVKTRLRTALIKVRRANQDKDRL